ncbi:SusD family protein [Tenacibaculum sp. MAR_2009_124]|uniref:RagB/SusD family nutrient uptake outer membrane protein n=1 Tax=Tenacibaculum sp. MAR_2009_124 TaxID=1250059 RepID=UPI00089D042A|nr:RagB/SusD family nutrient uptake outer membrane protein [Tenacibaculum sp. MAR_2009_124]SED19464.1 SusD family protein [Tenacibaculum sp. MAR_2009_124]
MLLKIKNILLVILAVTVTSCSEDFLDTKPTDAISAADALATAENMSLIINGMHRSLFTQSQTILPGGTGSTQRAGEHYWVPMGDNIAGGLLHSANANNLGWRNEMQWVSHTLPTSLTVRVFWYHRYNIIANANSIINKINEGSLTLDARLKEILAQAYTYRAYAYMSLVQHYAKGYLIGNPNTDPGVPLLFSTEAPFTSSPRSTVQEVYNQIFDDLEAAITTFNGASARSDKSQLNVNVAHGLKARAALNSGDWDKAIQAATAARNGYPLMSEAAWKSGFNTVALDEVIWGSVVIDTETTFFRSYFYLMSNTFNGSQVRNNPKFADRRLVDAIPNTDYRKDAFLNDAPNSNTSAANGQGGWANNVNPLYTTEAEFDAAISDLSSTWGWTSRHNTHPYMHVKMRQKTPGGILPDDIIYMRTSEMYLIEAEAKAMKNDVPGAQASLLPLASARDNAYDGSAFNTQETFLEHIKFQRGVELWGEGFLYVDKIRWDDGIDHGANGGSGASEILYQDAYVQDRPSVNDAWIFKIPQAEIDANPNLTPDDQN